jgi:competence protein ComEA
VPPPDPAVRIRSLLAGESRGGWVPPEPLPGTAPDPPLEDVTRAGTDHAADPPPDDVTRAPTNHAPDPPPDEATDLRTGLRPGLWPDGRHPDDEIPFPEEDPRSWGAGGVRTAAGAHRQPGRWTGALPVAVRSARLDPGRRGAAALVVVALLSAAVTGAVVLRGRPQEIAVAVPEVVRSGAPLSTGPSPSPAPGDEVVVAVAGKVVQPGLVRLPAGSRVADAVAAAGGPEPGTSTGLLNVARKLVDGEQVLVGVEPPPGAARAGPGPGAPGALVDLNSATVTELETLPGVGAVLAGRILDWRTENGRFGSVEQLREVKGIGEATFDDLRDKVTV